MTLYLVRHGQAGSRSAWGDDDTVRPLTRRGRRQAADMVDVFSDGGLTAVLSSPYRRCVETVAPLAAALGLCVEVDDALAEGRPGDAVALVRRMWRHPAALCSHGDIIPAVLEHLAVEDGVDLGPDPLYQKGSIWVVEPAAEQGHYATATYVGPLT